MTSRPFSVTSEWLEHVDRESPEQSAHAAISILVDGIFLTENKEHSKETLRSSALLSSLHLSEWFAANWWRLLWEPDGGKSTPEWELCHKIGAAGGGYVWPDITFISDWNTVLIHNLPTLPNAAEPIHYTREYSTFIPTSAFEKGLESFVSATVERLSKTTPTYRDLAALWAEVSKERQDPEIAHWRRLEACLGYDPDETPDTFMSRLQEESVHYGANAIQELAASSKSETLKDLQALKDDINGNGIVMSILQCQEIRDKMAAQIDQRRDLPWQRAIHAARIARHEWGLPNGPVSNKDLSDTFGVKNTDSLVESVGSQGPLSIAAGIRNDNSVEEVHISLSQKHSNSRRFAFVRLVGDSLIAQLDEPLLPATRAKTSRQKFQRAFAQEFLCPLEDLMSFLDNDTPNEDDIQNAADHFEVSTLLVANTLVNNGLLERERILGDRIAKFYSFRHSGL